MVAAEREMKVILILTILLIAAATALAYGAGVTAGVSVVTTQASRHDRNHHAAAVGRPVARSRGRRASPAAMKSGSVSRRLAGTPGAFEATLRRVQKGVCMRRVPSGPCVSRAAASRGTRGACVSHASVVVGRIHAERWHVSRFRGGISLGKISMSGADSVGIMSSRACTSGTTTRCRSSSKGWDHGILCGSRSGSSGRRRCAGS